MKKWIALSLLFVCVCGLVGCKWMYDAQYNENGVSHYLVITIDETQPKEYVGELDAHSVFVESFDMDTTYFITVTDEHVSVQEAIENNLVSIGEWKKYAWKTEIEESAEILQFENYEIVITQNECVFRPLSS